MTPAALEDYRARAYQTVKLYGSGLPASVALKQARLSTCYCEAVRECHEGGGPLTVATLSRRLDTLPSRIPTSLASFIRWFHRVDAIHGVDSEDNDRLVARLREAAALGANRRALAAASGLSPHTIRGLISGRAKRLKAERRPALWKALRDLGLEGSAV